MLPALPSCSRQASRLCSAGIALIDMYQCSEGTFLSLISKQTTEQNRYATVKLENIYYSTIKTSFIQHSSVLKNFCSKVIYNLTNKQQFLLRALIVWGFFLASASLVGTDIATRRPNMVWPRMYFSHILRIWIFSHVFIGELRRRLKYDNRLY